MSTSVPLRRTRLIPLRVGISLCLALAHVHAKVQTDVHVQVHCHVVLVVIDCLGQGRRCLDLTEVCWLIVRLV